MRKISILSILILIFSGASARANCSDQLLATHSGLASPKRHFSYFWAVEDRSVREEIQIFEDNRLVDAIPVSDLPSWRGLLLRKLISNDKKVVVLIYGEISQIIQGTIVIVNLETKRVTKLPYWSQSWAQRDIPVDYYKDEDGDLVVEFEVVVEDDRYSFEQKDVYRIRSTSVSVEDGRTFIDYPGYSRIFARERSAVRPYHLGEFK